MKENWGQIFEQPVDAVGNRSINMNFPDLLGSLWPLYGPTGAPPMRETTNALSPSAKRSPPPSRRRPAKPFTPRRSQSSARATRPPASLNPVRTIGAGPLRIYGRHVLPNILGPLAVTRTANGHETLLLETSLSVLGLSIQPPNTSLGALVGEGRADLTSAWWIVRLPGLAVSLCAAAVALLGDRLSDPDPQGLRNG